MIFEKFWAQVPVQSLTADGTLHGVLTISDTRVLRVKQRILLKSNTQPSTILQVNRVRSQTEFEVGRVGEAITHREDVSAFLVADSASFIANEQPRPKIGHEDFWRAVYAEEPAVALRTLNVDELGNPWNEVNPQPFLTSFIRNGVAQQVKEDTATPANNRPLPVKLTGVNGDVIIEAENLNLEVQLEGEYDAVENPKPDSVGTVHHERGLTQDRTKQTRRTTAVRGTENTSDVSQDVSLHDGGGERLDSTKAGTKRRLNVDNDGAYDGTNNTDPANVGLVAHQRNVSPSDTHQTERLTSVTNGTRKSLDVALNDSDGSQITIGQKTMAQSVPVVIASDQTSVPIRAHRGSLVDRSGTATTSSTEIAPANASRTYFFIQNISNFSIWINFGAPATTDKPSIRLQAGESHTLSGSFISTQAVNVITSAGSRDFTAKEG